MDTLTFVLIIAGIALLVQAGLALIVGYLAAKRGRSAVAYFWLSFLLTFVIGLIVLLIQTSGSQQVKRDYQNPNFGFLDGERAAKCPKCAEWIKVEASVCKHCGHEVGEYIQAQMHAQQAEESARIEKLETQLAAEREASQAARTKMLKSKKFRLFAAAGTVVVLGLIAFLSTSLVRNEMAKQPAPVTKVVFDFDSVHPWNPFCPVVYIVVDQGQDEARKAIIEDTYFGNDGGGLDTYELVLNGDQELRDESIRQLDFPAQPMISDDICRELAFSAGDKWTYEIFGSTYWAEKKSMFSGSVTIPWENPNYSSSTYSWYDDVYKVDFNPENFKSSATSVEFVGLTAAEENEKRGSFLSDGIMTVQKGKPYTVEFKNPAGSQIIKIEGR